MDTYYRDLDNGYEELYFDSYEQSLSVGTLTREDSLVGAVFSDKKDGIRMRLVIKENEVFLVNHSAHVKAGNFKKVFSLLDVELVGASLWIFDVLYWNGEYVYDKHILERMAVLDGVEIPVRYLTVKKQKYLQEPSEEWPEGFIVVLANGEIKKWKRRPTVDLMRTNRKRSPVFVTSDDFVVRIDLADIYKTNAGMVYECSFNGEQVVVHRQRKDKNEANTYATYMITREVRDWQFFIFP
jgi:hypothetical protein